MTTGVEAGFAPVAVCSLLPHALEARRILERAWSTDTAHHSVLPLMPEDMAARGQCGVSSVWFARRLMAAGFTARVAEGIRFVNGRPESYVWNQIGDPDDDLITDLAFDQYPDKRGSVLHVGTARPDDGCYEIRELFDPFAVPRRKLMARYAILEQRIKRQERWRHVGRILSGQW